jgi:Schlafen, AlbA_2
MSDSPTLLATLVRSLTAATSYNALDQDAPAAVLWPDAGSEWSALIPAVRDRRPVLIYGTYAPGNSTGPAPWLRCMLAHTLPDTLPEDAVPVIYLPGVSTRQLRAIEQETGDLPLLAELRYRSSVWCQRDGHDWTVTAFLKAPEYGLDVEVAETPETQSTLVQALPALADKTSAWLRARAPWKAWDFEEVMGHHAVEVEPTVQELIANGESATLEFKSTARWNVKARKEVTRMEHEIAKTVCAFLNSHRGGTLLIGVSDDGPPTRLVVRCAGSGSSTSHAIVPSRSGTCPLAVPPAVRHRFR